MVDPIGSITPITPLASLDSGLSKATKDVAGGKTADFSSTLSDALDKLEITQAEAQQAAADFATGQIDNFHTPVIAMQKATLAMSLAVTVRDKVVNAYKEIMQMQI